MSHVRKVPKLAQLSAVLALLAGTTLPAFAAEGLKLNPMPRWQARLQLNSLDSTSLNLDGSRVASGSRILSANLLGDYYLTGSGLGGVQGGLRATGGMLLGSPSLTQSSAGLALGLSSFQYGQRSLNLLTPNLDGADAGTSQSYLGIGYTGHVTRGGLSFSADLGLVSNLNLSGLRLGRSSAAGIDDAMRDMRYKPVLQLGLSYSY